VELLIDSVTRIRFSLVEEHDHEADLEADRYLRSFVIETVTGELTIELASRWRQSLEPVVDTGILSKGHSSGLAP
jgi:hypothetical protein